MKLARALPYLTALLLFAVPAVAHAQLDAASQTVTLDVQAVDDINVTGTFTITITTIGLQGANTTGTYDVSTNSVDARTITAQVGAALPTGVTLNILLQDPDAGGAATTTARNLTTGAQNVVTGLAQTVSGSKTITYTVTTTAETPVASTPVIVTLTLIV